MKNLVSSLVLLVCCWSGLRASGDNWPQFRGGPQTSGVAEGAGLPTEWSVDKNVAWKVDLPGRGWSSPVIWGNRLFVTTAISGERWKAPTPGIYGNDYIAELTAQGLPPEEVSRLVKLRDSEVPDEVGQDVTWKLLCLDVESGRVLWDRTVHVGPPVGGRHRKNTYASETPATDGERVYVYFGNLGLFAYSMEGEKLWERRWAPRKIYLDFGTASSPTVHGDAVYILNDNQEDSFLAAVDKRDGRVLWQTKRDFGDFIIRSTFVTPFVWKNSRRTEIVAPGPLELISYDLEGRELWRLKGVSAVSCPMPSAGGDTLYYSSGSPSEKVRPVYAVRAGASGDITLKKGEEKSRFVAWRDQRGGSYITSPLLYRGRFYVLYDKGFFAAYDAESGERIYKARIGRGGNHFSASPWADGGRVYCLSEEGNTFVLEAGDEYKVLAVNAMDEMSLATPAVSGDSLFLRTARKLYRIRKGAPSGAGR